MGAKERLIAVNSIQGPGIFLAQFIGSEAPFNTLDGLAAWAAGLGYKALQIPTSTPHIFDLKLAATSDTYCHDVRGRLASHGLQISELSTHLQGQLLAVHPAYDALFDGFADTPVRGNPAARTAWASEQLLWAASASKRLGLKAHATFSGALAWPYLYPWPQRPAGLLEEAFGELARRWLPVLNAFDEAGVDVCYELHPGEDLFDGSSFERFLDAVNQHARAKILYDPSHFLLQQLDYLAFIDVFHSRIGAFHVKDAEFRPTARQGVYGGYANWEDRAGRFRSLGDGQIDFRAIFSKLTQYGYRGFAVLEWECCLKHPQDGAREGAVFIQQHLIRRADRAFDDFAGSGADRAQLRRLMGIGS
jgi:sugar phosphate isomerase/epimerase